MVGKGNLAVFEGNSISKTIEVMPTKIDVHACYINAYLHEFFEPIPIDLTFWPPWTIVWKGNISKIRAAMPTKLVHLTSIPTCMNLLSRFYSIQFFHYHELYHGPKGKFGQIWKVVISPKPKRLCPPKLVCMHLISTPTCINFLSRFYLIQFFCYQSERKFGHFRK